MTGYDWPISLFWI